MAGSAREAGLDRSSCSPDRSFARRLGPRPKFVSSPVRTPFRRQRQKQPTHPRGRFLDINVTPNDRYYDRSARRERGRAIRA